MANMGVIPALINSEYAVAFSRDFRARIRVSDDAVLLSDELNHATINEGCRLAKATKVSYKHCDMNNLERKLRKFAEYKRKLILTDGVFSTDGRIAPLSDIVELAKKYDAMVYIDDATATGFMGEDGGGTAKHFGVQKDVDIIVTNLAKSVGVVGGIAAASEQMIKYLRITVKTYVFSGGLIGGLADGALKALEIIKTDGARRTRLWKNAGYLRDRLHAAGFDTLGSETPIVPIRIGAEETAAKMSKDLFDLGIFCPPFRYPAAPRRQALLRFNVTCQHSKQQIDRLVENLAILGKKYRIVD
jgi:7-keto-8-aminopelargonate synthetase-like enzyme